MTGYVTSMTREPYTDHPVVLASKPTLVKLINFILTVCTEYRCYKLRRRNLWTGGILKNRAKNFRPETSKSFETDTSFVDSYILCTVEDHSPTKDTVTVMSPFGFTGESLVTHKEASIVPSDLNLVPGVSDHTCVRSVDSVFVSRFLSLRLTELSDRTFCFCHLTLVTHEKSESVGDRFFLS